MPALSYSNIKFGLIAEDKKFEFLLHNLMSTKYFIHKYKFLKVTPRFTTFRKELSPFLDSLKWI